MKAHKHIIHPALTANVPEDIKDILRPSFDGCAECLFEELNDLFTGTIPEYVFNIPKLSRLKQQKIKRTFLKLNILTETRGDTFTIRRQGR